ncbi:MAG: histidine triad nucleotide-binding protein [Ignavibacteriaceae bacterium]
MSTIFKKIIDKEIPAQIVFESETVLAFKDINPQAPVHVLIIPKKEISSIREVDPIKDATLMNELITAANKIAKDLGIYDSGFRLVFNAGTDGGQDVYHLHLHLLGGRKMTWPPG